MPGRQRSKPSGKGRSSAATDSRSTTSTTGSSSALLTTIPEDSKSSEDVMMSDHPPTHSEPKRTSLTTAGEWFEFRKKRRTSDNTLDQIGFTGEFEYLRLKEESIAKCKSKDGTMESLKLRKEQIIKQCRKKHYKKWIMILHCGFSLLLWGVGSKRIVLSDFIANYCTVDGYAVLINGYSSLKDCNASGNSGQSSLARKIINQAFSLIYNSDGLSYRSKPKIDRDPLKSAQQLIDILNETDKRLYIGINSIDAIFNHSSHNNNNNNMILLQMLSLLCSKSRSRNNIHLVFSMDSPKIFLKSHFSNTIYHFYSFNINTYLHYDIECSIEWDTPTIDPSRSKSSRKRKTQGGRGGAGKSGGDGSDEKSSEEAESRQRMALRNLLNSLTPIHFEILLIVANNGRNENDLGDDDGSMDEDELNQGITYQELFDHCYEEMLVDSEVKFRALYTELTDHNAICEERLTADSEALCRIPYDLSVIQAEIINRHQIV